MTACPKSDTLLYEWLSPTPLQQGQAGRAFKWHLVSNAVIIMTVAVITGAVAGVYQLIPVILPFEAKVQGLRTKTAGAKHPLGSRFSDWGCVGLSWLQGNLVRVCPVAKSQTTQGFLRGDSHLSDTSHHRPPLWLVCNNLALWFYVVV